MASLIVRAGSQGPRVIGVRIIVGRLSPHAVAGKRGPMFSPTTLHSRDDVLDAFTEHLRVTRGAAPATCERSVRDVRQLLTLLSASGQLDLRQLTGEVLRGFVVDRARRHSPRTARRSASAARSFVRFLHLHGVIDGRLAQAVPTRPRYPSCDAAQGPRTRAVAPAAGGRRSVDACRSTRSRHAAVPRIARPARQGGRRVVTGRHRLARRDADDCDQQSATCPPPAVARPRWDAPSRRTCGQGGR